MSKPKRIHGKACLQGFTLVEAVAVTVAVGVLGYLAVMSFGLGPRRINVGRAQRILCVSNLKRIGIAFRLYSNDNNGHYPRFNTKFGTGYVWTNFAAARDEITSPWVLRCPMDTNRFNNYTTTFPVDFSKGSNGFSNPANQEHSLSYFYGLAANETSPSTLLAGDRNLTAGQASNPNGPDVSPMWSYAGRGPISLGGGTNGPVAPNCGWNSAMHHFNGNILLGDGSVQQVTTPRLIEQLKMSEDTNNVCVFPINSPGEN